MQYAREFNGTQTKRLPCAVTEMPFLDPKREKARAYGDRSRQQIGRSEFVRSRELECTTRFKQIVGKRANKELRPLSLF